jgi:hypothetical protein
MLAQSNATAAGLPGVVLQSSTAVSAPAPLLAAALTDRRKRSSHRHQ